jgi:hypothetical protein
MEIAMGIAVYSCMQSHRNWGYQGTIMNYSFKLQKPAAVDEMPDENSATMAFS